MQGCTRGRQDQATVGGRAGATVWRLSGQAVRLARAAVPVVALALILAATLPAPDGGGQLVASALADERSSDGAAGGGSRGNDHADDDDAQGGNDADDDAQGENDGDDDGDDGGGKGGKTGGRGIGKSGGRGGASADSSTGHRESGDDDDRDDAAEAHGDGHDPSAAAPPGDLSDGALEDRVVAAGIAPGLASFRATVLSDDEEAAAIAAGWAPAD